MKIEKVLRTLAPRFDHIVVVVRLIATIRLLSYDLEVTSSKFLKKFHR